MAAGGMTMSSSPTTQRSGRPERGDRLGGVVRIAISF